MIAEVRKRFALLFRTLEVIVIFFIFALVNINSFVRFRQFPEVDNYSANELEYIFVALVTVILLVFSLWRNQLLPTYLVVWKNNKLLILFLAYALVSLLWTVYLPATLYKLFWLFFSTIAGSYIAIRYRLRGTIDVLTWVGGIFAILSLLIVLYLPFVGVMQNQPFVGSWTGLFWHRNHTGNIFAFFSMIYLLRFLLDNKLAVTQKVTIGLFYVLSAAIVFGSRSATGIIVFLFLHFAVSLTTIWLRWNRWIKPWQYYLSAALLVAGFLVFITNTGFFFGLLGRTAHMTGRIPLWQDLLANFYLQKPILGYGYGALWMQKSFRILIQIRHEWPYQVYFADNGFFDILLNTGLVGLLLFLSIYLPLGLRSFKQAIAYKSWIYFFPFLTFLYIFIGNLTYSFLLEVDQLVWMLLVIMVFATTSPNNNINDQPYSQPNSTKLKNEVWNN
jgi:exopolysaccharide production protein ExoQ